MDDIHIINKRQLLYPRLLRKNMPFQSPSRLTAIGNLDILNQKKLALFCSVKCPGLPVLKTYELANKLRDAGITVISGFHSPIEKKCLGILLRGKQPVIISPARSIDNMRLPASYETPLREGRLLVLSFFSSEESRISAERSRSRNLFVGAMADFIFVLHAAKNSKTEKFYHQMHLWNKQIYTFDLKDNISILQSGAKALTDQSLLKFK